jgi:hypothetical protein
MTANQNICRGCNNHIDLVDPTFATDTRRCDFCYLLLSEQCASCYRNTTRCEGLCNRTCCFLCFQEKDQCVYDCFFTCAECSSKEYCYVIRGQICDQCQKNHAKSCGCIYYEVTDDDNATDDE